jgi:hypothetical protein
MATVDPRTDGRLARTGPVTMYHASDATAAVLRSEGIRPGENGEIWVATRPEIADLQVGVGREIRSIARVTVQVELLEYLRSHDGIHLFCQFEGDPLQILQVDDWPSIAAS